MRASGETAAADRRSDARLLLATVLLAAVPAAPARAAADGACVLALDEQRSGRALARVPLAAPGFAIAFEHSVLGHTVVDRYELRAGPAGPRAHLVEERFDGAGYGLPQAAEGERERMRRSADGWVLELDRVVDPLVVRPLPEQNVRLRIGGRELRLAELSAHGIALTARGCTTAVSARFPPILSDR